MWNNKKIIIFFGSLLVICFSMLSFSAIQFAFSYPNKGISTVKSAPVQKTVIELSIDGKLLPFAEVDNSSTTIHIVVDDNQITDIQTN